MYRFKDSLVQDILLSQCISVRQQILDCIHPKIISSNTRNSKSPDLFMVPADSGAITCWCTYAGQVYIENIVFLLGHYTEVLRAGKAIEKSSYQLLSC